MNFYPKNSGGTQNTAALRHRFQKRAYPAEKRRGQKRRGSVTLFYKTRASPTQRFVGLPPPRKRAALCAVCAYRHRRYLAMRAYQSKGLPQPARLHVISRERQYLPLAMRAKLEAGTAGKKRRGRVASSSFFGRGDKVFAIGEDTRFARMRTCSSKDGLCRQVRIKGDSTIKKPPFRRFFMVEVTRFELATSTSRT